MKIFLLFLSLTCLYVIAELVIKHPLSFLYVYLNENSFRINKSILVGILFAIAVISLIFVIK